MLETIRTASKTWIAKLILVLITVPFAMWGIESYVRTPAGQDTVASVGREKISSAEFNDAVRNQLEQFRRQFGGQVDASIMDNPEMRKNILDQLIDQRLIAKATEDAGVRISDETLRQRIGSEVTFHEDGKFSLPRYQSYLKANAQTEAAFERQMRATLARSEFANSIVATGITSNTSANLVYQASEQSREIAMVNVTPEQFLDKVKVTPEQAKAYYEANQKEFTVPEQVRAEYVELSVENLAPTVTVPAEEVKTFYDTNTARFLSKEERKASHILINAAPTASDADKKAAKEKADGLYAQLQKNIKLFPELAKQHSQDPGSGAQGGDLGFFSRGMMVKEFDAAVFGAKKGELLPPVLTSFGYHIILVTDVKPPKGKSLAEATPEIEGELKKQAAARKFAESAEKFTNAAYEQSTSLKAAADVAGLPVKQTAWMSKGMGSAPPFNHPKLAAAIFADDPVRNKRNTEAIEVGTNHLVVARVLEHKPAVVRPLAEVEKSIIAKLSREEAGKLARKDGEAKLADLKAGKPVDLKWPSLLAVSRSNPGGLPPAVIDAVMKVDPKALPGYTGTDNPAGGYSILQVAKVIEPAAADEARAKAFKTRLAQTVLQQELQALLAQIRARSSVTVAPDALAKKEN